MKLEISATGFYTRQHDAIDYVYQTYLHGRTYHLYAPATTSGSHWPNALLQQAPDAFDSLDIHDYNLNTSAEVPEPLT